MAVPKRASGASTRSRSRSGIRRWVTTATTVLPTVTTVLVAVLACAVALFWRTNDGSSRQVPPDYEKEWDFRFNDDLAVGMDRCNIPRVSEQDLTAEQFALKYWRRAPVIIERHEQNRAAQRITEKQVLLSNFAQQSVPLAGYEAYAFRGKPTNRTLGAYLSGMSAVTAETSANTTRFAFGMDQFGVGDVYEVPRVVRELQKFNSNKQNKKQNKERWHFQVAVAESGAGLAFHWHGHVFAETLHGQRRWFLLPPETSPTFNPRATSARWLLQARSSQNQQQRGALQECTLTPNEAIYVPADWFHSTLSLGQAVSITTSLAAAYRRDRYQVDNGTSDHAYMLDALERKDFAQAIHHAHRLVQFRPHNFSPRSWLGVLYTLQSRVLARAAIDSEQAVVDSLEAAAAATRTCIELNPLYAPCHVWQSRQLTALAMIYDSQDKDKDKNDNDKDDSTSTIASSRSMALHKEAEASRRAAAALSSVDDDEILDPRWQPKALKQSG
jgi:hypothetical protein